jgi:hypothetical protein
VFMRIKKLFTTSSNFRNHNKKTQGFKTEIA